MALPPPRVALNLMKGMADMAHSSQAGLQALIHHRAQRETKKVHIVFDGPPAHESGRFIETETPDGKSIRLGHWIKRDDGYWALEIEVLA